MLWKVVLTQSLIIKVHKTDPKIQIQGDVDYLFCSTRPVNLKHLAVAQLKQLNILK